MQGPSLHGRSSELIRSIQMTLREMTTELVLLNQQVGDQLDMRLGDLQCLDLIDRIGPINPSALARRTGIHPATLTGIVDRLEKAGWLVRDRDPMDRRAVALRATRDRGAEVMRLYSVMLSRLFEICQGFDEQGLEAIASFLRQTVEAGRRATDDLAGG